MFTPIHFASLRKSEFLSFFKEIVECCKRFDIVALLIESRVVALIAEALKLDLVYNKDGGSDITDLLDAIDDRRDHAITGIKLCCEGFVHSHNKPIALAATLILRVINKHPSGIGRLNYKAETSEINSLILQWAGSTKMTAALATLGFTEWVAELKQANILFSSTQQDRIEDKYKSEGDSFTKLRPDTLAAYDKLCKGIVAHFELDKNPEHLKLIDTINLIVDEYNLLLSKREGGGDDDTDNDADNDTDTDGSDSE